MKRPRILALVLAGGEGGRLAPLTDERAKPALPFAGVYRLIDFPLSNCVHSGIGDVWVIQQYEPHELTRQLANGRPWDLDRTRGGLRILHPYLGDSESGWYEGNADAIYRNREVIADHDPDVLLVLSADHVYKLDYADVVNDQLESGAAVTMVTTNVAREQASRHGVVRVDRQGRVREFEYKPDAPASDLVTTEVFAYDARRLMRALDELAGEGDSSGLRDFGHELLPRLVDERAARAFQLDGSLVAAGACVRGTVARSVIGPGVVVEEGADVRDAVLLHDGYVGAGARVRRAILDERAHVDDNAVVGDGDDIAVVAAGARVAASDLDPE